MPFVAEHDGQIVTPNMVTREDDIACPVCEEEMTVKKSHYRGGVFVARHFAHLPDVECEGESDEHLRMKAIAHSKLAEEFPDAVILPEEPVGDRQADLLVDFEQPQDPYGKGVTVEVQYRNYAKDRKETTRDYLDMGYSVLWLYPRHYSGMDVTIDGIITAWPNAVTHPSESGYPSFSSNQQHSVERTVPIPRGGESQTAKRVLRWHWMKGRIERVREHTEDAQGENVVSHTAETPDGNYDMSLALTDEDEHELCIREKRGEYEIADISVLLDPRTDVTRLVRFALDADTLHRAAEINPTANRWQSVIKADIGGGRRGVERLEYGVNGDGRSGIRIYGDEDREWIEMPASEEIIQGVIELVVGVAGATEPRHLEGFSEDYTTRLP